MLYCAHEEEVAQGNRKGELFAWRGEFMNLCDLWHNPINKQIDPGATGTKPFKTPICHNSKYRLQSFDAANYSCHTGIARRSNKT